MDIAQARATGLLTVLVWPSSHKDNCATTYYIKSRYVVAPMHETKSHTDKSLFFCKQEDEIRQAEQLSECYVQNFETSLSVIELRRGNENKSTLFSNTFFVSCCIKK